MSNKKKSNILLCLLLSLPFWIYLFLYVNENLKSNVFEATIIQTGSVYKNYYTTQINRSVYNYYEPIVVQYHDGDEVKTAKLTIIRRSEGSLPSIGEKIKIQIHTNKSIEEYTPVVNAGATLAIALFAGFPLLLMIRGKEKKNVKTNIFEDTTTSAGK
jgi:hypothetical protein